MFCDKQIIDELNFFGINPGKDGDLNLMTTERFRNGAVVRIRIYCPKSGLIKITDDGALYRNLLSRFGDVEEHQYKKLKYYVGKKKSIRLSSSCIFTEVRDKNKLIGNIYSFIEGLKDLSEKMANYLASSSGDAFKKRVINEIEFNLSIHKKQLIKEPKITGESGRVHQFASKISTKTENILIQPVKNHVHSISSNFVRFSDIPKGNYSTEAVIDDYDNWKTEDLSLLNKVAKVNQMQDISKMLESYNLKYN